MNIDIIFTITLAGITLGFVEGVKPGPLLTMVIRETLSGGLKAGSKAALAPVFTDGPMIILSLIFAGWVSNQPLILIIISVLGAIYLAWMGIECFGINPPSSELSNDNAAGSLKRGILTNLLNPNVYIFWFLIGGPIMATAFEENPLSPLFYATSFLVSIILVKIGIAFLFDITRGQLSKKSYKFTLGICGIAMILFSIGFSYQAFTIYSTHYL